MEATEGQRGLTIGFSESPDLVLLDLSLPVLSGLKVARKMKENSKTSHIPIVACSAWQHKAMVTESLKAGVVDYLTKPFSVKKLVAVIQRQIGNARDSQADEAESVSIDEQAQPLVI